MEPISPPQQFWIRLALAFISLSYGIYALALAGFARTPWVMAATLAAVAVAVFWTRPAWRRPSVAWLAFLPMLVLYVAHAWGPEFQPDAAGYHLGLAAEWLRDGRLPKRIGFYEVLPQGMEMLFGAAMSLGGSVAARLLHLGFLIGCAGLLIRLGAQPPAALIFLAIPVAAVSGTSAYTDAALVFFLLAALALLEEDRPFTAGLCAGFVYAVKISGLIALPAAALWLVWKRRPRSILPFAAGAVLTIAPWMARTVWLTGNPLAPLANGLFPNDAFHPGTDATFLHSVHASLPWWKIPWAVAVDGFATQGLLGPCFLLVALLALGAVMRERGRLWLIAAAIFLVPWLLNPGARFALPSAAFLCLAVSEVLPSRVLWALACLHAVLSLPPVMDRYAHPQAWRLRGWRHELPDTWFASTRMVNRHVKPGERVLDLAGLPTLYLNQVPTGPASSSEVDQLTDTLYRGTGTPSPRFELRAEWPMRFVRALRVRAGNPPASIPWSVAEITPVRAGEPIPVLANWFVEAWPVPAGAALAADGNAASRWQSWLPAAKGAFVELRFDRPVPLDGARVLLENYQTQQDVRLYVQSAADRRWSEAPVRWRQLPPALPRRAAIALLRSRGIRWIVAKDEREGFGEIGQALRMAPEAWGAAPVDRVDNLWLFRIGDAPATP